MESARQPTVSWLLLFDVERYCNETWDVSVGVVLGWLGWLGWLRFLQLCSALFSEVLRWQLQNSFLKYQCAWHMIWYFYVFHLLPSPPCTSTIRVLEFLGLADLDPSSHFLLLLIGFTFKVFRFNMFLLRCMEGLATEWLAVIGSSWPWRRDFDLDSLSTASLPLDAFSILAQPR